MLSAFVLFGVLCVLEYFIWLTPVKKAVDRLSLSGMAFYVFPLHYWIRIFLTVTILLVFHPTIPTPFGGTWSWVTSLVLGMVVCRISLVVFKLSVSRLSEAVRSSHSSRFWIHSAYILFYPSLIEELLFRWLLVVMLQPSVGWWVLLLAPIINTVWHLPVWIHSFKRNGVVGWGQIATVAVQALTLAVTLTAIYVATQNLIGVVIAHAFGDWVNIAIQYAAPKARQQKPTGGQTYES